MPAAPATDWRKDFGIEGRRPPALFSSLREIDEAGSAAPLPHALRRAFEELQLDGVLCFEQEQTRTPIIYFRQVERIETVEVARLHRLFWNQGIAPLLVLIAQDQVHVYSGLTDVRGAGDQNHGLVETLNRVADRLRAFILAVESGEYFQTNQQLFDPRHRVDRDLLHNLQATRDQLEKVPAARLSPYTLDSLLCRLVFTCYLFDRQVIDRTYLESLGIHNAAHLRDILSRTSRTKAKEELYSLFEQLSRDFNGDLFSDDLNAEAYQVKIEHVRVAGNPM